MKHLVWCLLFTLVCGLGADRVAGQQAEGGAAPQAEEPVIPDYTAHILTPPAPDTPRINGAKVFGVRPGHPFLYAIPATGQRPIKFSVENLPSGLSVDSETGIITGKLDSAGTHEMTFVAENSLGRNERPFRVVVGETIALTPPMGWNSWNAGGPHISQEKILANAKAMRDLGLVNHGWQYINIDDAWQGVRGGEFNAIQGNEKFPDMKGMCDEVHAMGLKVGIYSTPWITSYAGYIGGSANTPEGTWSKDQPRIYATDNATSASAAGGSKKRPPEIKDGKYLFAENDAKQWAAWGIDYLKYDWNPKSAAVTEHAGFHKQVKDMADALRASGRDIVYSYSNSMPFEEIQHVAQYLNAWRTTGDIRDNWGSMSSKGFNSDRWAPYASPGHWNDPDMMVFGLVGWSGRVSNTKLTPDEQYTHMSLWCLVASPLLLGHDLTKTDPFTLSLLTNDEVIAVNQDPLGKHALTVSKVENADDPGQEVYDQERNRSVPKTLEVLAKDMEDGSKAAGLFNRSTKTAKVTAKWSDLGITGKHRVRDLWRQQDLGEFENEFSAEVNPHGVLLVQVFPVK